MRIFLIPIGIGLILWGPFILWNAEFQHRALDYQSSVMMQEDSDESGHVKVKGVPNVAEALECPPSEALEDQTCLSVVKTVSEFTRKEVEQCTSTRPSNVIRSLPEQCDSKGENCEPCYLVEKESWESIDSESQFAAFSLGKYNVPSRFEAEVLGEQSYVEYESVESRSDSFFLTDERTPSKVNAVPGDREYSYQYITSSQDIIVSGLANESLEIGAGEKTFVISALTDAETLAALQSKDNMSKWGLRVMSLLMVVFGFVFIFNTIAAIPLMLVKIIPFLGKPLENGISSVISMVAGLIGLVVWGLMWATVLMLKNIIALVVIGAVVVLAALAVVRFAKKNHIPLKKTVKDLQKN